MLPGKTYTVDEIAKVIWRRKWLLILPFVAVTVGTAIVAHFLPNKYRSETLMLVVPQRVPESYVQSTVTTKIEDRLNSISQQIMSRTRLERIILDNNLYPRERASKPLQDVVEQMRKDIAIEVISKGDAFRVSYVGTNPRTVKTVAETLASLFNSENLNDRAQQAEQTNEFLETQLDNARQQLKAQEAKLEAYRKQYSGELPSQAEANLQVIQNTQLQIQAVLQTLNHARDRKMMVESLLNDLTLPDTQPALLDPTGAPGVQTQALTAREQLAIAQAQLRALQSQLTPEHPDVIKAKRQIAELQQRAEAEAATAPLSPEASAILTPAEANRRNQIKRYQLELDSLNRQITTAETQERQLRGTASQYQARLETVPARETELAELTRDYTTLQKVYSDLLQRSEAAKVAANLERRQIGEQFRILDPARLPERPVSPNRPLIDLIGTGAGLVAGVFLLAFQEYRDTTFRTEEDINGVLQLPVLAQIPLMTSTAEEQRLRRRRAVMSTAALAASVCVGVVVWKLGVIAELFR